MSQTLANQAKHLFSGDNPEQVVQHTLNIMGGAAGTAGTDLGETVAAVAPYKCRVVGVQFAATAAVTANSSNYATFTLEDSSGNVIASRATNSDNVVALTGEPLAPVAAYADLDAGDPLVIDVIKTASGVATPSFAMTVVLEPRDA